MNPDLPDAALAFEAAARHAFADLGGVAFARRAEADPSVRSEAAAALDALGADDLDPRDGAAPAGAAAVLSRAAGAVVLPYPVEATLLGDPATGRPFAVVATLPRRCEAKRRDPTQDPATAHRTAHDADLDAAVHDTARDRLPDAPLDDPAPLGAAPHDPVHGDTAPHVTAGGRPAEHGPVRVDHGDLAPSWDVATLDGLRGTGTWDRIGSGVHASAKLGPFCADLVIDGPMTTAGEHDDDLIRTAWWLTLTSWRILGALEQAVTLAARHTSEREQFDKPLTAFQTVRFALADASVAVTGLGELARFTLWRLTTDPDRAYGDALALRCHAVDVAREVLRSTQHLHGATGLCDEADISILVRHLQPALRLPESADATARRLTYVIDRNGFAGLFPHGSVA